MQIRSVAGLTLCIVSLACAGTPPPTSPTATSAATSIALPSPPPETGSSSSRVHAGTITEPECLVARPCRLIGEIRVTTNNGALTGNYSPLTTLGAQTLANIYDFALLARLAGTHRIAGSSGTPMISLQVTAQLATVTVQFPAPGDRLFEATASTQPVFTSIPDSSCVLSGLRLQTRLVVTLEHLGKTEITDSHCTLV